VGSDILRDPPEILPTSAAAVIAEPEGTAVNNEPPANRKVEEVTSRTVIPSGMPLPVIVIPGAIPAAETTESAVVPAIAGIEVTNSTAAELN
jgi:hypothetical protein